MSHEIMQHDKQQGREIAWHKLTEVRPDLSLENCWLNEWDYAPRPVMIDGLKTPFSALGVTDNCEVEICDADGNPTGDKTPLIIGLPYQTKTFKPVLNARLLGLLIKATEGRGLTLESCGTVFNRGRLFVSFGLAGANFEVNGQQYKPFLNLGNGNDKSSPLWLNTSNTKTVCNNTFTMNMGDSGLIMSVKKTQFSDFKLADMGAAIDAMLSGQKSFARQIVALGNLACDETTAREFFAGFITPDPTAPLSARAVTNLDRLTQLFNGGLGNDGNDFNDVFQALTDFFTHEAASSKGDGAANWKNFVSSEFGAGKNAKMKAWDLLSKKETREGVILMGRQVLKLTAQAI